MCSARTIKNVEQLVRTGAGHQSWLFRGHRSSSPKRKPVPEIFRPENWPEPDGKVVDERNKKKRVPKCGLEPYLGQAFRDYAHAVYARCPEEDQYFEWLALMQHHGAPTRLLDWTRNILVAAYFAVEPAAHVCKSTEAAIWAINAPLLTDETRLAHSKNKDKQKKALFRCGCIKRQKMADGRARKEWSVIHAMEGLAKQALMDERFWKDEHCRSEDCCKSPLAVAPPRTFPRLVSQSAWFTIHPIPSSETLSLTQIANAYEQRRRGKERMLECFTIPAASKMAILDELAAIGITRASLFPDLDGLARSLIPNVCRLFPGFRRHHDRQQSKHRSNY